jgi:hypothetical protein
MEARLKTALGGVSVVAFLLGAMATAFVLTAVQPLVGLASPTPLSIDEIKAVALVFLASVALMEPAKAALRGRAEPLTSALHHQVRLPAAAKAVAVAVFVVGFFVFAFWSIADVLGGYNGYGYSFAQHPILQTIYNDFVGRIPYISSEDKGTQGSFFFILACLALTALRSSRGVGTALKDTVTLFAAPCLVVFELALWYYAPQDMTWHVTDYLWMGGTADGGYRAYDLGGAYIFSNWLVLFVSLFLVASRLPWLALPSKIIWQKRREEALALARTG